MLGTVLRGPLGPTCEKVQSPQVGKITSSHSWLEAIGAKTLCGQVNKKGLLGNVPLIIPEDGGFQLLVLP